MRNRTMGFGFAGRLLAAAILAVAILTHSPPAASAAAAASTPQDRARFLALVQKLEAAPLDPKLASDREWAFGWLAEIPDIQVSVCPAPLEGWDQPNFRYKSEILYQYVFSMGAFIIEHSDKAQDLRAQYMAGVEGALKAYGVVLKSDPEARSSGLDTLLDLQSRGELTGFVAKASIKCLAGKGQPT